jgi:WD40 repeat protein
MPAVTRAPRRFELQSIWTTSVDDYATAIRFSAAGDECAVGCGSGVLHVIDARTGKTRWQALAHEHGVLAVAWSPACGVLATAGADGKARLYDGDGRPFAELPGTGAWVEHLSWSSDGSKLATTSGRHVRLWNADGSPFLETEPHPTTVTGVAWNRLGTELATSCSGGVHLFDLAAKARARHLPWKGSLISLAWSPDDKIIACGTQDCAVHFWRLPSGKDAEMSGYRFKSRAIAWDSRSTLLATTGEATITVWDFGGRGPEGSTPLQLEAHKSQVVQVAFGPRKGTLASGAQDGSVMLWDPRKAKAPVAYAFLEDVVSGIAWDPMQRWVAAVDGAGTVGCWAAPG